jgi:ribulose-phosphate 3-epimerase
VKGFLAPSILSFDLPDLRGAVRTFIKGGAEIVHLDVMDGQFVPPITFGDAYVKSLRDCVDALFEVHLMTLSPERHVEPFAEAGCGRIIFHAEATSHAHRIAQSIRALGVQAGIALNPGTPIEMVSELVDVLDLVLVMTVNPGWGGQAFIPSCLEKVRRLRERAPNIHIEVDGGVDPHTLPLLREAGANVFVVGSFLARAPDLEQGVKDLVGMLS